jgi:hypothetical protein
MLLLSADAGFYYDAAVTASPPCGGPWAAGGVRTPPRRHRDRVGGRGALGERVKAAPPVQRPARLSTLAGTPTSRNAAALTPVRFAHEAATLTNAFSSSGNRAAWSIWAS